MIPYPFWSNLTSQAPSPGMPNMFPQDAAFMPGSAPITQETIQEVLQAQTQKNAMDDYSEMIKRYRQMFESSLKEREKALSTTKNHAALIAQNMGTPQLDLSPLIALAEAESGKRMGQGYQKPENYMNKVMQAEALQRGIAQEERGLSTDKLQALKMASEQSLMQTRLGNIQSPGMRAFNTKFGNKWADFSVGGGYVDVQNNIKDLENAVKELKSSGKNLTGPVIGRNPEWSPFRSQESIDIKDRIENVAQRSIKEVLDTRFTEQEGMQVIRRAFNPTLKEPINAARLERFINRLKQAANAKLEAGKWFDSHNGDMSGFKGKVYGLDDFANYDYETGKEVKSDISDNAKMPDFGKQYDEMMKSQGK